MKFAVLHAVFLLSVLPLHAESVIILDEPGAVEYALRRSPEVLSAAEGVEEASARLSAVKAGFLPRIEASGHYSMYRNHPAVPFDDNTGYRFDITQNIFTGGRLTRDRSAAERGVEAARWGSIESENAVRFRTLDAFYAALLAEAVLRINRESLSLSEEMLAAVRRRFEGGEASRYELLRQGVEAENLRSEVLSAETGLKQAVNMLKSVIGAPPPAEIIIDGTLDFHYEAVEEEAAVLFALENRPALREAASRLESASMGVLSARSGRLPGVLISASNIANRKEAFSGERGSYDDYWEARVSVSVPVFDGGLTGARVREAASAERRMEIMLRGRERNVELEVRNALLELKSAARRVGFQKDNVAAAREAYGIANRRYLSGEASHLDVSDARLALSRAELNYAGGLRDHIVAKAKLRLAAGGDVFSQYHPRGEKDE